MCGGVEHDALIIFRAVQGLGAGAVQPTAMTIVGDIYTLAERARVQGYLASVWAISSVVGPLLGGVFSQLGIWRGVFLINIPLCLLAAWMFSRHFHEKVTHRQRSVDTSGQRCWPAMTSLILGVLGGGQTWAWSSVPSISTFAGGADLLIAFVVVERRAAEPVLPLWVFSRRLLCATTIVAFGVGAILMGLTSYGDGRQVDPVDDCLVVLDRARRYLDPEIPLRAQHREPEPAFGDDLVLRRPDRHHFRGRVPLGQHVLDCAFTHRAILPG